MLESSGAWLNKRAQKAAHSSFDGCSDAVRHLSCLYDRSRLQELTWQRAGVAAMTDFNPPGAGWTAIDDDPMPGGLGTTWRRRQGDGWIYGLLTRKDHANRFGAIHGGILVAFADHTLGNIADTVADGARHATIQLNTHFLAAVEPGEFLELHAEVTRATGSMAFVRGIVSVGQKDVLAVDGIWRIFRPRQK